MSPRTDLKSRIARALAAHSVRVADPDHAEWAKAMMHEQEHLPPGAPALSWALDCVLVSYRARLYTMTRSPLLLNEALLAISLLCLAPASWNFFYIAVNTLQGHPLFPEARPALSMMQAGIFLSATLIGPIGLAATLWTLSSPARRPGTMFMVFLWALTAWAIYMLRLPAQYPLLVHVGPGGEIPTILLNFVLLPFLGVAMLQGLDARRRRLAELNI
jgi:hypothetical protein